MDEHWDIRERVIRIERCAHEYGGVSRVVNLIWGRDVKLIVETYFRTRGAKNRRQLLGLRQRRHRTELEPIEEFDFKVVQFRASDSPDVGIVPVGIKNIEIGF